MHRIVLLVLLTACTTSTPAPRPSSGDEASTGASAATSGDQRSDVAYARVPAAGKRFDPPASVDEMPPGAWYCDMGTVHYARKDQGDATCPVCGMELSHKAE